MQVMNLSSVSTGVHSLEDHSDVGEADEKNIGYSKFQVCLGED